MRAKQIILRSGVILGLGSLLGLFFASQIFMNALYSNYEMTWSAALGIALPQWYAWVVFIPLILWLTRRLPLERAKWKRNLSIHLLVSIVITILKLVIVGVVSSSVTWIPSRTVSVSYFHTNLFTYWALLGFAHAFDFYRKYRERELKASQLEARLAQTQLQVLKMQLHPHFLFNTLHTISSLMHKDVEAADRMIAQLSDLLRLTLENVGVQEVSLKQELEFLSSYLEIEQTRFQDRLRIETDIDQEALDALVPNLILQPLVENAIRHGIEPYAVPGKVEIRARSENGRLNLQISDDGPGISDAKPSRINEGIGLANTKARLEQLYGAAHRFELNNTDNSGLVVSFSIPFKLAHEATVAENQDD